jgi:Cu(I)/Ag(I) efflux system protein CusF
MKTSLFKASAAIGFTLLAFNAYAGPASGDKGMDMGGMKMDCKGMENMKDMKMDCMGGKSGKNSAKAGSMSEGEVKGIDKANHSVTLKHGPIESKTVEMGPMTMTFAVQKPGLLKNVKVGDKVKFIVENVNESPTVTALEVQK